MAISKIENNSLASGVPSRSQLPAGTVLQVVSASTTSSLTTTSSTYSDVTGLSVTLTPTTATSKFLTIVNLNGDHTVSTGTWFRLNRNGTDITLNWVYIGQPANAEYAGQTTVINYLDSPNTGSAVTYKVRWATDVNGQASYLNRSDVGSQFGFTSTITVMEIAA